MKTISEAGAQAVQVAQTWEAAGNKQGMVNQLGALLVESPGIFFSRRLLAECRTFVTWREGRTGAASRRMATS